MDIVRNVSVENNITVCVFSLEIAKKQLGELFLCATGKIDSNCFRTDRIQDDKNLLRFASAVKRLSKSPIYISDTPDLTVSEMMEISKTLKRKHDLGLIIIDYVQLIPKAITGSNNTLGNTVKALKDMAQKLNIPVVILSQIKRDIENRVECRPVNTDLPSKFLGYYADVILFLCRKKTYQQIGNTVTQELFSLIISKNRNGAIGDISLSFSSKYRSFCELERYWWQTSN